MGHSYGKLKHLDLLQVHFLAKMFIRLDFLYYRYTIKHQIESQDLKYTKFWVLFHLVKHSMNIMGHPYGKLKHLDLLQVHFFDQNVHRIRFPLISLYYKTSN